MSVCLSISGTAVSPRAGPASRGHAHYVLEKRAPDSPERGWFGCPGSTKEDAAHSACVGLEGT